MRPRRFGTGGVLGIAALAVAGLALGDACARVVGRRLRRREAGASGDRRLAADAHAPLLPGPRGGAARGARRDAATS